MQRQADSNHQREQLKKYLWQYKNALIKKRQLESRLQAFRKDMGTGSPRPSRMPKGKEINDEPATIVVKICEIEERIDSQKAEMTRCILNVMDIIEFLPIDSMERTIIEYRHIDCLSWRQVTYKTNYSRTAADNYYKAGIDRLIKFKKVRKTIESYVV